MILNDLLVKKAIVIKTKSELDMMEISKMIHHQLIGRRDYIESKIILSIGDGSNTEIPDNEIHVYIFNDCSFEPILCIGKFLNSMELTIEISVQKRDEVDIIYKDIEYQLENNRDRMFSNILVVSSNILKNEDNGYCVKIYYNSNRKSTPSLII